MNSFYTTASVIANLQGEAIYACTLDGFTPFAMTIAVTCSVIPQGEAIPAGMTGRRAGC